MHDVPVAYKGVFVSLIPRKTPWIAIEIITAGAPNDLNVKYCCAGLNIGEFCTKNNIGRHYTENSKVAKRKVFKCQITKNPKFKINNVLSESMR